MKIAKFLSAILAAAGSIVMAGAIALCLMSLDTEARIVKTPEDAVSCAEAMVQAIDSGDFSAASALMYGQPDLGVDGVPEEKIGQMIWDAFLESISCQLDKEYYVRNSMLCYDAAVTALDIPSVTKNLQSRFRALLDARMESAEDMSELYDENNDFRADLLSELLEQAVAQALEEDAQMVTREFTLELIQQDGAWWVVPNQSLLQALSGGVA